MKLYIAGPMSGYPEFNFPAFHAEAARLRGLGFDVVSPAEICASSTDWLACMRADVKQLVDCDGIALLTGWEQSRGAGVEEALARGLGLRIMQAVHIIGLAEEMPVLSSEVLGDLVAEAQ